VQLTLKFTRSPATQATTTMRRMVQGDLEMPPSPVVQREREQEHMGLQGQVGLLLEQAQEDDLDLERDRSERLAGLVVVCVFACVVLAYKLRGDHFDLLCVWALYRELRPVSRNGHYTDPSGRCANQRVRLASLDGRRSLGRLCPKFKRQKQRRFGKCG
jgi:hypothetical protein